MDEAFWKGRPLRADPAMQEPAAPIMNQSTAPAIRCSMTFCRGHDGKGSIDLPLVGGGRRKAA
ncbi:MAG: hypothetical protein ACK4ZN_15400, partial [Oceanibaculum sp.]